MYDIDLGDLFQLAIRKSDPDDRKLKAIRRGIYFFQDKKGLGMSLQQALDRLPDTDTEDELFKTIFWSRYKTPPEVKNSFPEIPDDKYIRYYDLREEVIVSPNDEEYPLFLFLNIQLYQNPFELDKFLNYHYDRCLAERKDIFQMLYIVGEVQKKEGVYEIDDLNHSLMQKWINQHEEAIQKGPKKAKVKANGFSHMTNYQQVLLFYYYHKYFNIHLRQNIDVVFLARVIHLLADKPPIKDPPNSDIYKMVSRAPNYKGDKMLLDDLEVVKELLETHGLAEVAKHLEEEITACKENLDSTKRLGG